MAVQEISLEFTAEDLASSAMEHVVKTAEKLAGAAEQAERHVAGAMGAPGSPVATAASSGVSRLVGGLQTLSNKFDGLSSGLTTLIGVGGGLGVALGFHKMFEVVQEKIGDVIRLKKLTGLVTEEASALVETFEAVGVGADSSGSIIQRMVIQAQRMKEAGGAGAARRSFQELGVDIRKGPVQSMLEMSKRVKDGKLETVQLARGMRLSYMEADQLMKVLKTGPAAIRESMKETGGVEDRDIAAFKAMKQAQLDAGRAWEDISFVIGRELLPIVAELLQTVAANAKQWIEPAKQFGELLRDHLQGAITLATRLGKVLLANAALQKTTGMGLGGAAQAAWTGGKSLATGVIGSTAIGAALGGGGSMAWFTAAMTTLGTILLPLTVAILALVGGFYGLMENTWHVRDYLVDAFAGLQAALETMFSPIVAMFSSGPGLVLADFFKVILPAAVGVLVNVVDILVTGLTVLSRLAVEVAKAMAAFSAGDFRAFGNIDVSRIAAEVAAERERRKTAILNAGEHKAAAGDNAKAKKGDFIQNFPGARFDITQKFEEGFDPDRVLTAFTNDLAALGERGTMSGFQPAFAGATSKG
jgi:hypothetical protein